MKLENFKVIPEYPKYLISPYGEVYSTKSNKLLTHHLGSAGYPFVTFYEHGKNVSIVLHRLLARVFKDLPSLESELEVDHKDRNKLNFSLDNLVVMTKEDHRIKTTVERGHTIGGNKCPYCNKQINSSSKTCFDCKPKSSPDITAEQIEYWVINYSWVKASKELGLSDNGLRKRYKSLTGKDPKSIKKKVSQVG